MFISSGDQALPSTAELENFITTWFCDTFYLSQTYDNHFAVLCCVFHLHKLHFACINVYPVLFACCVGALCVFVLHCVCVCVCMRACVRRTWRSFLWRASS